MLNCDPRAPLSSYLNIEGGGLGGAGEVEYMPLSFDEPITCKRKVVYFYCPSTVASCSFLEGGWLGLNPFMVSLGQGDTHIEGGG